MDEALALPSEHAVTIALRTQQIIAEESGVTNTVDPLGGSFFVEPRPTGLRRRRMNTFAGSKTWAECCPPLIRASFKARSPMPPTATSVRSTLRSGHIVGVNAYEDHKPLSIPILQMDPQGYQLQVSRLEEVRRTRDGGRVGQCLDRLRIACEGTENMMPHVVEAVHAYATLVRSFR